MKQPNKHKSIFLKKENSIQKHETNKIPSRKIKLI